MNDNAHPSENTHALVSDVADNRVVMVPDPDDVLRMANILSIHVGWSAFWDKRYGVWRISEDDPSSGLYEESTDARTVIAYVAAHS